MSNSVVTLDEEWRITGFLERPDEETRRGINSNWVNSGVAICDPKLLEHIPESKVCDLPRDIYTKLVSSGQLFGFPLSSYRCAVDSPDRLAEVRAAIAASGKNWLVT
jgi:mannose-1-phosphate guanylyltransferase/phosphomannomutase